MGRRQRGGNFTTHISREVETENDWCEVEITVEAKYIPGDPGRLSGPPEDCYPPEPPEVEIVSAVDPDGNQVELTSAEVDKVYEAGCDFDFNDYDDYEPDNSGPWDSDPYWEPKK